MPHGVWLQRGGQDLAPDSVVQAQGPNLQAMLPLTQSRQGDACSPAQGRVWWSEKGWVEAQTGCGLSRCRAWGVFGSPPCTAPRPCPVSLPRPAGLTRKQICCSRWGVIHQLCFSPHALLPLLSSLAKFGV